MPALIPVDNLWGAALIGTTVSAVVYGISCLQVYLYYVRYGAKDRPFLKNLVAVIWLLDTFHLALLIMTIYHYTITNFGDYIALIRADWTLLVNIGIGALLSSMVQCFFAYRIFHFSGQNRFLAGLIVILSMLQLAFAIVFMQNGFKIRLFTRTKEIQKWGAPALSLDIACDTVITTSMCYYLHRSRTGFTSTNRAINLLITYTINTCLLTTVSTAACLALFVSMPTTQVYTPFYYMLCRLYANSLLSTLNSRESIRDTLNADGTDVVVISQAGQKQSAMSGFKAATVNGTQSQGSSDYPSSHTTSYGKQEGNRVHYATTVEV